MSLHPKTIDAITSNMNKFSLEIQKSLDILFSLIENYSAMSDVCYLLYKAEVEIPGIKLPSGEGSWLPIRNLFRIIAKVGSLTFDGTIGNIYLENMSCGCDYFEGNLEIEIDGKVHRGAYKWQWTAFGDHERSYDKFTTFPKLIPVEITSGGS